MRLVKVAIIDWVNESRDKRELSAAREAGYEVCVMAKGDAGDRLRKDEVDGFTVYHQSTRPIGHINHLEPLNRLLSVFIWARQVRQLKPDAISGHDIVALLIGYLSCWYKPKAKRPTLIYDSHEFELLRNPNRSRFTLFWLKHLEHFLMKRCAFSIMVNDSIADGVQHIHKLSDRPLVVRSIPDKWVVDPSVTAGIKRGWLSDMQLPDDTFVLMYHGIVMKNRGIEAIIEVVCKVPGTAAVILGNSQDGDYRASLRLLCEQRGVADRVLFVPAVPLGELWKYIGASDVGMVTYSNAVGNYRYLLPNKFFENIQAETPVICYDTPELSRLTNEYGIGLLVKPDDIDGIARSIERLMRDTELYKNCKENTSRAKEVLCWENEKSELVAAYQRLICRSKTKQLNCEGRKAASDT